MKNTTKRSIAAALSLARFNTRCFAAIAFAGVITSACNVHRMTGPGTLASIAMSPNITLSVGSKAQFFAVGRDADGGVVDIAPVWSVTAGGGTIDAAGMFTAGIVPGEFIGTVLASVESVAGRASIMVVAGSPRSITIVHAAANVTGSRSARPQTK